MPGVRQTLGLRSKSIVRGVAEVWTVGNIAFSPRSRALHAPARESAVYGQISIYDRFGYLESRRSLFRMSMQLLLFHVKPFERLRRYSIRDCCIEVRSVPYGIAVNMLLQTAFLLEGTGIE